MKIMIHGSLYIVCLLYTAVGYGMNPFSGIQNLVSGSQKTAQSQGASAGMTRIEPNTVPAITFHSTQDNISITYDYDRIVLHKNKKVLSFHAPSEVKIQGKDKQNNIILYVYDLSDFAVDKVYEVIFKNGKMKVFDGTDQLIPKEQWIKSAKTKKWTLQERDDETELVVEE